MSRYVLLLTLSLVCFVTQAQIRGRTEIVVEYPPSGAVLGQGYDTLRGKPTPAVCVSGAPATLPQATATTSFKDVTDRSALLDQLKVSASGKASMGAVSGSAKASYAKTVNIQSNKRNIHVQVDAYKGGTMLTPQSSQGVVTLAPQVEKFSTEEFRRHCGDGYIAAIRSGRNLSLVFTYALDSKELNERSTASASAKGSSGNAKASFSRIRNKQVGHEQVTVDFFQSGGSPSVPTKVDQALEKIENFAIGEPQEWPAIEIVVVPYHTLPSLSKELRGEMRVSFANDLPNHYWRLVDLGNAYAEAATRPWDFYHPFQDSGELSSIAAGIHNAARCVEQRVLQCQESGACGTDGRVDIQLQSCISMKAERGEQMVTIQMLTGQGSDKASQLVDDLSKGAQTPNSSKPPAQTLAVYDSYFEYLARQPQRREVESEKKVRDTDFVKLLEAHCLKAGLPGCDNIKGGLLTSSPTINSPSQLKNIVKAYVADVQLAPVAASYCDTDIDHDLCQLPDVLNSYVDRASGSLQVDASRNFSTAPPPRPAATKKEPRRCLDCRNDHGGYGR